MIVPSGTPEDALAIPLTVGMLNPLPFVTRIIPSVFVTLYPDIKLYSFDLYIPYSRDHKPTKKSCISARPFLF
jgi:hypothetical protein